MVKVPATFKLFAGFTVSLAPSKILRLLQKPTKVLVTSGLFVVAGIIRLSDAMGVPCGSQLVGVFQSVLVAPVHVFEVPAGVKTVTVVGAEYTALQGEF